MIDVKFLEQFVNMQSMASSYDNRCYISEVNRIASTRLYGLNVPRCTGKTTALENFAKTRSALRFDGVTTSFVTSFQKIGGVFIERMPLGSFRGRQSDGMKYQCCVADEFKMNMSKEGVKEFFWQTIVDLNNANLLTKDFYILYLGTETV